MFCLRPHSPDFSFRVITMAINEVGAFDTNQPENNVGNRKEWTRRDLNPGPSPILPYLPMKADRACFP